MPLYSLRLDDPRLRVLLTAFGALTLLFASYRWGNREMASWSLPFGAIIAIAGLFMRIWATAWLNKKRVLSTGGPYSYTRNPLYLGTLLLTLGHGFMSALPFAPLLFPALLLALYWPTILKEERYLAKHHGSDFQEYRRRVPRLIPRLWKSDHGALPSQTFQSSRIRRCYKGFLANAAAIAIYFFISAAR